MALQACELRANLTKAMPLDSFVCLSRTTQISWISPKGEKRSLSTDSGVYLLITRKMRLLGGSSKLSTPGRKPPPLAQLPASSMVLHPGAGVRPRSLSVLLASAVPPPPLSHNYPLRVRRSASGRRKSPALSGRAGYRLPGSDLQRPLATWGSLTQFLPSIPRSRGPNTRCAILVPCPVWSTGFNPHNPPETKDSSPKLAILVISSVEDHHRTELKRKNLRAEKNI